MWVRSLGALEGRRHGRGSGGVGDAGGCGARAPRHVSTSGGRRRGAGGEGWVSQRAGPLRELFHMRLWRPTAVCHRAPHMREWVPPAAMDRPQTHASSPS